MVNELMAIPSARDCLDAFLALVRYIIDVHESQTAHTFRYSLVSRYEPCGPGQL